ncbi:MULTISPECIES: ChrR family anti-sigma-E factor [unclassified Agarivorans]|uniref:ChrR family anti-sigma-E factor n=1 Tax=unclassified Agarivorans TaxID=2636026 RepID=UPI0010DA49D3|nr:MULTISPECIES: ChrR family anti-sigma-E factor [unclassified Agarivorans]MDO6684153.1 ChrR family anti-sigma-E factor [Agarivorans sp. 3_MG-2023]MDO6714113.1 ChrR family anti-sigma-E factor [Agarivorans sp. 2_MG-2023]MDO6762643.1 ChrR family anti-sigma-E factor [Agarivorans sp. 1_MG-2023]GDY24826.1 transcriptional regulator [Agarivorans sp. Toyoura001]
MTSIQFHPVEETLNLYAAGQLDPAMSIMVSAHLEYCTECRQRVHAIEQKMAAQLEDTQPAAMSNDLDSMLQMIMQQSAETVIEPSQPRLQEEISLGDKRFPLPRALQAHPQHIGPWGRLPGKIQRARVDAVSDSKMNFIYMDQDSALPEHTHQGQEITLVLAGTFIDDAGSYVPGDFIIQNTENKHTPRTAANQDCLCLTLLDAPLHFTSGLASLLNPFSQLFFK